MESTWERFQRRRNEWISQNGPCAYCGSSEYLEVDHIDPSTKSNRLRDFKNGLRKRSIWSLDLETRTAELKKCQVLCYTCHKAKSDKEMHKEVCSNGRAMTPDNIYTDRTRARLCWACKRKRQHDQTAKRSFLRLGIREIKKAPVFVEFS